MTGEAAFIDKLSSDRAYAVQAVRNVFGFDHLLMNIYNDPAHFIYEVAQNAEDARASRLRIGMEEKRVTVAHNGKDFDRADVESVTKIAISSKGGTEQIGRFGVGFKSVFALTDQPEIHSGGFHFAIKKLVIPFQIPPEGDGQGTLIALPLKLDKPDLIEIVAERMNYLFRAPEDAILFLANIREFRMRWGDRTEDVILRKDGKFRPSGADLESAEVVITGGANGEKRFRVFRRERLEVAYLSARDADELTPEHNPPVAVYFPTGSHPELNFRMHIPYTPDASRQTVNYEDKDNAKLTANAARLVADTLPVLRDERLLTASFIRNILPDVSELSQDAALESTNPARLRLAVAREVKEKIASGEKLLPAAGGGHVAAMDAILGLENLSEFLSEEDAREIWGRGKWIDPGLRNIPIISALEIPQVSLRNFAERVGDDFFQRRDDDWLTRFYGALADKFPHRHNWRATPAVSDPLSRKPFIRLKGGYCAAPFDSLGRRQIYLPGGHKSFPAVKQAFLDDERSEKFLKDTLGLRAPTLEDMVEKVIVPRYSEGRVSDVNENDHAMDMLMILEATDDQRARIGELLRELPIVRARLAGAVRAEFRRPADCFFSNENTDAWFADTEIFFADEEFYKERLDSKWPGCRKFFTRLGARSLTLKDVVEKVIAPRYPAGRVPDVDENDHAEHMRAILEAMDEHIENLLRELPIVRVRMAGTDRAEFHRPADCWFTNKRTDDWFDGTETPFADEEFYKKQLGAEWPECRDFFERLGVAHSTFASVVEKVIAPRYFNGASEVNKDLHIDHLKMIIKAVEENPDEIFGLLHKCPIVRVQANTGAATPRYCMPERCRFPNKWMRAWCDDLGLKVPFVDADFYEKRLPGEWRECLVRLGVAKDIKWSEFDGRLNFLLAPEQERMTFPRSKIVWEFVTKHCHELGWSTGKKLAGYSWLFDSDGNRIQSAWHGDFSLSDLERAGYPRCRGPRAHIVASVIGLKMEDEDGDEILDDVKLVRKDEYDEMKRELEETKRKLEEYERSRPQPEVGPQDLPSPDQMEFIEVPPSTRQPPVISSETTGGTLERGNNEKIGGPLFTPESESETERNDAGQPLSGQWAEECAQRWLQEQFPGCEVISGNENGQSKGYDLIVKRPECAPLYVEVKGRKGVNPSYVDVTRAQWEMARQQGENFWLLVIAYKGGEDGVVICLKNPYDKFRASELDAHPVRVWL